MQINKLLLNRTYSGLIAVVFFALIAVLINNPASDLEERVTDLENRVTVLEEMVTEPEKIETTTRVSDNRENWRKLREGMSEDQVRELLGEPYRIQGGRSALWHYQMGGSIHFHRGKVESWSEPF